MSLASGAAAGSAYSSGAPSVWMMLPRWLADGTYDVAGDVAVAVVVVPHAAAVAEMAAVAVAAVAAVASRRSRAGSGSYTVRPPRR